MALGSAKGGIWGGLIGACACVARRLPGSLRIEEIRPAPTRSSVRFETALRMLYVYWVARVVLLPLAFRLFLVWRAVPPSSRTCVIWHIPSRLGS